MNRFAVIVIASLVLGGCYNFDKKTEGRSALEQQLIRTAIARAIDRLSIHKAVRKGTWKIEIAAPSPLDVSWIRLYLRRRLSTLGARISRDQKANLPIVEVGVVTAGTDIDNFYIGIPLPGTGSVVGFINSIIEKGRARIGLTFWSQEGTIIGQSDQKDGSAYYKSIWYMTFIGPFGYTDLDIDISGRFSDTAKENWEQVKDAGDWLIPDIMTDPEPEPKD